MPKKPTPQSRGGLARAKVLSAKTRSEIARKAALIRHHGPNKKPRTPPRSTVTLQVKLVLPPDATAMAAGEYVLDAVTSWRGSLRPPGAYEPADEGDPMYGLDIDSVQVAIVRTKKPVSKGRKRATA